MQKELVHYTSKKHNQDECNGYVDGFERAIELFALYDVNVSIADVRQAFANYHTSEGCSCCQDVEAHDKAEEMLADLLKPDAYNDGSGFDWTKYATKR